MYSVVAWWSQTKEQQPVTQVTPWMAADFGLVGAWPCGMAPVSGVCLGLAELDMRAVSYGGFWGWYLLRPVAAVRVRPLGQEFGLWRSG